MALELERRVRGGDPRVRQVAFADYGDMAAEAAIATSTGITATARRTICSVAVAAIAGADTDSQTGVGFSAARGPGDLDLDKAAADAVERSTRMIGATKARSGRCVVILDPRVTSTLLAVVSSALSGEAVTKGRSFFADRVGEEVAVRVPGPRGRPHRRPVVRGLDPRRRGPGLPAQRPHRGRRPARLRLRHDRGAPCRRRPRRPRRCGAATPPPRWRGAGPWLCRPGSLQMAEILADVGEGLFVQSITGVHSGVNPVSGDFSVGAEGLMVRGGVLAEPVREVTIASTLQRMLQSVAAHRGRRGMAPGRGRRSDPGHRRDGVERLVGRGTARLARSPRIGTGPDRAQVPAALRRRRGRSARGRGPGLLRRV